MHQGPLQEGTVQVVSLIYSSYTTTIGPRGLIGALWKLFTSKLHHREHGFQNEEPKGCPRKKLSEDPTQKPKFSWKQDSLQTPACEILLSIWYADPKMRPLGLARFQKPRRPSDKLLPERPSVLRELNSRLHQVYPKGPSTKIPGIYPTP